MDNFTHSSVQIIEVNKTNNTLEFFEDRYNQEISKLKGNNKVLFKGSVGKMREGKSTELNICYYLLTGRNDRPFSDIGRCETNTKGIHITVVPWDTICETYKNMLVANYGEKVDIVLLDCEGTESSNETATSRLYLVNMLLNSVIHIHVSKAIDQNFANKLVMALVSSNEILQKLGQQKILNEILPGLSILIKNSNEKAWEQTKLSDPSIKVYEDLLKKYDNLYNYYKQFPNKEVVLIPTPKTDEDGDICVYDKSTNFFKGLEKLFNSSLMIKKLKNREEISFFIHKLMSIINENDIMNIKSELDSFYEGMFNKEKNLMINLIITKIIESFITMADFSMEQISNHVFNIAGHEMNEFNKRIENISCKWIFEKFQVQIEEQITNIIQKLQDFYMRKKQQYLLDRETKKVNENIFGTEKEERKEYSVEKKHSTFVYMYPCCGNTDKNSQGEASYVTEGKTGGNKFVKTITFGLLGNSRPKFDVNYKHMKSWGEYCTNCYKGRGSTECISDVKTDLKEFSREVLKGVKQNYTMEEWNDNNFKQDASNFLLKIIGS